MVNSALSSRLNRHLLACSAVAVLGAVSVQQNAEAAIVYSGLVNLNVPSTTAGIYLNVVTGVSSTAPASAPGWDLNPWSSTAFNVWANNAASPNDGVISGLGTSTT